ncbi:MAG: type transport system ATP-binding protein, partial [Actinomycetota bacterium]|nr:type transport system ATP-binding protein [Actinomycetota bacterium]
MHHKVPREARYRKSGPWAVPTYDGGVGTPAVSCHGVWKSYRIYHQRSHTLKEKVLSRRNRYDDFWALKGIDLDVDEGSTIGIIGPNGSGKSTLLKTMARILSPNKGTVEVNGTVSPLLELGTGFHPELTGRENIFLGCSLLGLGRKAVEPRFDEIVDFAGVEEFIDVPIKNYSSGMYARLAFSVAISVEPEILIIDEVLSVGDEEFQMKCNKRMARLRAEGRTIVLVSHSLPTIQTLCSEAVWLENGTVREMGPARDIVGHYLADVQETIAAEQADGQGVMNSRFGSGEAEIVDVTMLGPGGVEGTTFRHGDPVTVRVKYRSEDGVDQMAL